MIAQSIQRSFERSFGTSCFLAYFALLFFRHTEEMTGLYLPYATAVGILFVIIFALCAHLADRLDRIGPARLSVIACVLCAIGAMLLEIPSASILFAFGGFLSLLGCVTFFLILGKNLAFYDHQERICQLSAAFLVGSAVIAIAATLNDAAMFAISIILPLLTALHLCVLKVNKGTFSFADLAASRKSHRFSVTVLFTTAVTGFIWGIAFCLIAKPYHPTVAAPLHFALPIALAGLISIIDLFKWKKISEHSLLRIFSTAAFVAIAPLPFVPEWVQQLLGAYLFLAFSFDTIVCFSAMGEVARFNQISPYWVFGISLAYYFSGAFIGYLGFEWAFAQEQPIPLAAICFGSLLLIIWCSSYVFQDSYPSGESLADLAEASSSLLKNESRPALWQRKIDRVIEHYELTARQQEVFRMLVRGRNAQYVADKFFYFEQYGEKPTSTTSTASSTFTPSKNSSILSKTQKTPPQKRFRPVRNPHCTSRGDSFPHTMPSHRTR